MDALIASLYFLVLFLSQMVYVAHLYSSDSVKVRDAANVAPHYAFNNLLHFAFVMLFVRSRFGWAEFLVAVNFANMSVCYFRHNTYSRLIHWPAISAPLAWSFVAIYWNGAVWVPSTTSLALRILGHVFIWSILAYGMFFMVLYRDYTMGFSLSVLSAAIGVGQFFIKVVSFQWIFAFTIMAVLFATAVGIAVMAWI
ncbi:MAG: DUF1774 domain-containing protein, partial [Spirochaetales bacterium]|nr:DUF1774 domain-containing protein [Spirochaetales bacterium]